MPYYIFYDPRKNNRIMGESTEKEALNFPYIVVNKWHNNLQNLEIRMNAGQAELKINNDYKYIRKYN